jgi:hypothetical protein
VDEDVEEPVKICKKKRIWWFNEMRFLLVVWRSLLSGSAAGSCAVAA